MIFNADQWFTAVKRVSAVLKKRFPNLTVDETLTLANDLVKAVFTEEEK